MIDARNTFRQINTTLRDFSPDQMAGLTIIIKSYRGDDVSEQFASNSWLKDHFENGEYEDIEGLCKIVDLAEIEENAWSLTPGCYVGYSIEIDENFDYQSRIGEIHSDLGTLNKEANDLMTQILRGAT